MTFVCTDGGKRAAICDSNEKAASLRRQQLEQQNRDIFFTYHCYCSRKDVGLAFSIIFSLCNKKMSSSTMHRKCHDVLFLFMIPPFIISISFLLFIDVQNFVSDTLPRCLTRRHRYRKSINRLCCLCCNREVGSWCSAAWIFEVISPSNLLTWSSSQNGERKRKNLTIRGQKIISSNIRGVCKTALDYYATVICLKCLFLQGFCTAIIE